MRKRCLVTKLYWADFKAIMSARNYRLDYGWWNLKKKKFSGGKLQLSLDYNKKLIL